MPGGGGGWGWGSGWLSLALPPLRSNPALDPRSIITRSKEHHHVGAVPSLVRTAGRRLVGNSTSLASACECWPCRAPRAPLDRPASTSLLTAPGALLRPTRLRPARTPPPPPPRPPRSFMQRSGAWVFTTYAWSMTLLALSVVCAFGSTGKWQVSSLPTAQRQRSAAHVLYCTVLYCAARWGTPGPLGRRKL